MDIIKGIFNQQKSTKNNNVRNSEITCPRQKEICYGPPNRKCSRHIQHVYDRFSTMKSSRDYQNLLATFLCLKQNFKNIWLLAKKIFRINLMAVKNMDQKIPKSIKIKANIFFQYDI